MKQRLEHIDFLRGTGIVLMIMAHIGFGQWFDHFVHAFHMPLFFFISGYFFKRKPAKEFFGRKVITLIIPYIVYTAVIFLGSKLLFLQPEESIVHVFFYMNDTSFIAAALWFLPALFVANSIFWCIIRVAKSEITSFILTVSIAVAGNLAHIIYGGVFPFAIDASLVGVGMMYAGYSLHTHEKTLQRLLCLKWHEIVLGFTLFGAFIFLNGPVNMRKGQYGILPLFWLNAIGMCVILYNVSARLTAMRFWEKGGLLRLLMLTVVNIGKRSMTFLCLNQVIISILFMIWPVFTNSTVLSFLHNALCLIAVLIVIYPLAYLREKYTPFR